MIIAGEDSGHARVLPRSGLRAPVPNRAPTMPAPLVGCEGFFFFQFQRHHGAVLLLIRYWPSARRLQGCEIPGSRRWAISCWAPGGGFSTGLLFPTICLSFLLSQ